ncbi:MAG: histidinol dehydrogenase, partial [Phycisphaerales bacterium]
MSVEQGVLLRRVSAAEVARSVRPAVDAETLAAAGEIVGSVRTGGEVAVRSFAERFGERASGEPLVLDRRAMRAALDGLSAEERGVLERTAARIEAFAAAQRAA